MIVCSFHDFCFHVNQRLTEFKLKNIFSELKVQDKEELQLKRLKADNLDKEGLKESEIRKKFGSIIDRYGLADHFDKNLASGAEDNNVDNKLNNNVIFKDKKLNKLWLKAETAGFSGMILYSNNVLANY